MALRELLLAAERARQPLDGAFLEFARALRLSPAGADADADEDANEDEDAAAQFLAVHPQGELLLRVWPSEHGAGRRWERRESFAVFLHVAAQLLRRQARRDAAQAEAFALRVVRDKAAQLEKLLSWSDKPRVAFRALQLLGAVARVSGAAARELVRLFNFQSAAFVTLAARRWKRPQAVEEQEQEQEQVGDRQEQAEAARAPVQLRAAYVELVLALAACPDRSVRRFAAKEGGVAASLFKAMDGDPSELLAAIFERLGELVLHNPELERKSKLAVFNATCVHQLLALLQAEDDDGVRDTALAVLNALFFEDSALYVVPQKQALRLFLSKSTAASAEEDVTTPEQAYALKVIRNALGTIGVNELLRSTQAQTLVMQFLAKYPGFLAEYLAALSVQLEPKPVYRWFCVASLVQKLLACSLDAVASGMPTAKNEEALSSWCSAQSLASRLIAPGNFRKELSRCIQHTNNLVIYSSLGVIEATLNRYVRLASSLQSLGLATEVQSELRFLLPSPEALVSLLLKLCAFQERSIALIYVRAITVFRLYLECLPQTMREVKVDFTKTLAWRYLDDPADETFEQMLPAPMQSMIVGEMLRFLLAVDTPRLRFLFTSGNSGKRSKLQQMMLLYVSTPSKAVQKLAGQVLQRTLLASDIFGQETQLQEGRGRHIAGGRANEEIAFWLESLRQGGGKTCAEFTEHLTRIVMSDPLMYIAIGRRVVTDSASSSLSPITVALVGFLSSRNGVVGKADLSAYRSDPRVVAFAVRILLALVPTSKRPHQIVALIASNEAFVDMEKEENNEPSIDDANGKKRKRPSDADDAAHEGDAYLWLKAHCEALISGKRESSNFSTPKKKARAANSKWYRFSDPNALTGALVAMSPLDFTSSWEHIVSNCADIKDSYSPVLHYLSARGDVDILSLLTSVVATSKAQKKHVSATTAVEAFTMTVPAHIVLQHILIGIANKGPKEQDLAIAALTRITGIYTRSLMQTLLSSYSMSLSRFDRSLRVLFEDFEAQGSGLTLVSMGFRFGASSTILSSAEDSAPSPKLSHNDLVDDSAWVLGGGIEQNRVRATIEYFPLDREVSTAGDASLLDLDGELPGESFDNGTELTMVGKDKKEGEAYDPAFLLPMLSHFISSSDLPEGGIVQQGLLGIAIRATSSDVERIREFAYGILAHLHESLQATTETTSDFKAGRQVHLLLDVFRRGVEEPLEQVPSVVTVFLNDALAVLTRPTHVLYPQVNHFLLARPAMDLADVPMFYSLFNSRAPLTFRQERSWLLHTLRRGVRNDDDVALLVRRHVLPMLLSFYTSELADTHTQPLIANILLSALRTPSGGVYLITKTALVEWLAAQFLRHGAASLSTKPRSDKSSGSMRAASSALLLPLMALFEQTLQNDVWDELDPIQQHATALQAAHAFASLQSALVGRTAGSKNDALATKAAIVTELVVRRAGSVCSLQLLHKAVKAVQLASTFESTSIRAFGCAQMVASNLPRWLLQQRHHEAQKLRFPDWAILLSDVASILVACSTGAASTEQQHARSALEQLKTVLDQVPSLKQLVLSDKEGTTSDYAPALL
ncbi:Nucleolar pre-ribosomal-associated protein 1, N-terminal [Phytophthora cinnamomi]|uniref:Nucleolar pre-ribosomal-associated protein 1, N-terminal n=1 Tax=Phytophthora cinnamomi TaxID=4785 RepID=UPI003559D39D|nr:Nucleolar pre-ribosomal-associated protein 1, N-terminal [Phytophthora cinnamomi]